jgi:hypothetical protein
MPLGVRRGPSHCYAAEIPGIARTALGRLLSHVPLQTGRWSEITKVEHPMAQVDPNAPVVNDRYRATNQVRGVLPEDLLVGEGGGQIAVGVGLGE